MDVNDLVPEYKEGKLVGWLCSRCGWRVKRDASIPEIDDLARVRAEYLDHTCSPLEKKDR